MSLATVWRSWNSDMSRRTMFSSLPNMNSARALTSSVLPTPVGPRNRKAPMGRRWSLSPARARRTALEMLRMASSWPTMRLCISCSMRSSRSVSSMASRVTGMPVHMLTTSAMSSLVTLLRSSSRSSCHSRSRPSIFSTSRISRSRSSAAYSYCWEEMASSFSLRTFSSTFMTSFTERGVVELRRRTLEPASSMRSMALSGRNRSAMNRAERLAAVEMASSVISTLWCSSYRLLTPWRMSVVSSMVGSATWMGWNRRSRAGSRSTCLR